MEGELKKWTNYVTRWKKRYFELRSGILQYSKTKDGKRKGTIYMSTTEIKIGKNRCRIYLDTGTSKIELKAADQKEASKWFTAMLQEKEAMQNRTSQLEFPRERVESVPELIEAINYTKRLWTIHKVMEEKFASIPHGIRSQIQEFMDCASEFKNLALDALNILEEERKKNNEDGSEDDFQDAKSHVTDFFEEIKVQELEIPYRSKLPVSRNPNQKINIWKIIKDTIGKDLSKIAVPVYFNEPLSFLQRFTEDLSYYSILIKAAAQEDRYLRHALVACFTVSGYADSYKRTMKPFNPLLGETFELEKDGFRAISEQVCHHPPISAIHCDHPDFTFYASSKVITSFKGTYMKVKPTGKFHLILNKFGDHFVWEKPYTNVNNIILGSINVDHHGTIEVKNITTEDVAHITLKKKGWFNKDIHVVSGNIMDSSSGEAKYTIEGHWSSSLKVINEETKEEIMAYTSNKPLPDYEYSYFFSEFAMQLNLPPEFFPNLPRTDSRFRPDQRALENADLELAGNEKHRVEEKQRTVRKIREEKGEEWKPMWFYINDEGDWVYKGGYWQAKQYGNFEGIPDIF